MDSSSVPAGDQRPDAGTASLSLIDVVVPPYRERAAVPALCAALRRTLPLLPRSQLLLIDDGSDDGTAEECARCLADGEPAFAWRILRHHRNQGLTAALRTGFFAGRAPIHCWLDADLSYDADLLLELVGQVRRGADVAVASPYHPQGRVESVPPVRLLLSRTMSGAYRLLWRDLPHTCSSMVRAWRRSCLERCLPERPGHLGVTESLLRAHGRGARVVEVPATLRGRTTGRSSLRLVRTVVGQLGLLRDAVFGGLEAAEGKR
jgi:dolichol-phosphate mannosyltransferase